MPNPRPPQFTSSGVIYNDQLTIAQVVAGGATGTGTAAVSAQDYALVRLNVRNVSFVGGTTPSLTVQLQHSPDGSTSWVNVGAAFAAVNAGQTARNIVTGLDRFLRVTYTTSGAPTSVSFIVDGEAV